MFFFFLSVRLNKFLSSKVSTRWVENRSAHFYIVYLVWGRTSACKGTPARCYQSIFDLTMVQTRPDHDTENSVPYISLIWHLEKKENNIKTAGWRVPELHGVYVWDQANRMTVSQNESAELICEYFFPSPVMIMSVVLRNHQYSSKTSLIKSGSDKHYEWTKLCLTNLL